MKNFFKNPAAKSLWGLKNIYTMPSTVYSVAVWLGFTFLFYAALFIAFYVLYAHIIAKAHIIATYTLHQSTYLFSFQSSIFCIGIKPLKGLISYFVCAIIGIEPNDY